MYVSVTHREPQPVSSDDILVELEEDGTRDRVNIHIGATMRTYLALEPEEARLLAEKILKALEA